MAELSIVAGNGAEHALPRTRRELVRLERVRKVFANGVIALEGLDLSVGEHEFVSLLGPSGCGKSTALRLIAGLGEVSAGRIVWEGGATGRRGRRDIGFVFQEPTLMPWATVWSNVYLPLRLERVARRHAAARVDAALAMVGLDGFEGAYPRELSGGMILALALWEAVVRINQIPHYILPGPILVFQSLIQDWGTLFPSLLITLQITFMALAVATVGGVGLAILFTTSRWIEISLFPFAVILQVTPIISIAPLILDLRRQRAFSAPDLRLDRRLLPDPLQHHARP
jgi:ABC-type thiamine transport system ATPase subunit